MDRRVWHNSFNLLIEGEVIENIIGINHFDNCFMGTGDYNGFNNVEIQQYFADG